MCLKIVIDENIPFARELFSQFGEVELFAGRSIPPNFLKKADVLIVRSVTQVNSKLLVDTPVQFVGTTTAGVDHVDQSYLLNESIAFSSAPGCNAEAVAEYVFAALLWFAKRDRFFLYDKVVGIVGLGNVGSCLYRKLSLFGVPTLLYDPLLLIHNSKLKVQFSPLEKLVSESDILTLHVPLICDGQYPTWHMVDYDLLGALSENCILINTSRGAVIDNIALLHVLKSGKKLKVVLDVWENEPDLLFPLIRYVDIGTPHIAGLTLEGKIRGILQVFNDCKNFFGINQFVCSVPFPLSPEHYFEIYEDINQDILFCLSNFLYDIINDDISLRRNIGMFFNAFDCLRKNYLVRREWSSICIKSLNTEYSTRFKNLGFSI